VPSFLPYAPPAAARAACAGVERAAAGSPSLHGLDAELCKPVAIAASGSATVIWVIGVLLSLAFPVVSSAPNLSRRQVPPLP
jgi:hypothetical protein